MKTAFKKNSFKLFLLVFVLAIGWYLSFPLRSNQFTQQLKEAEAVLREEPNDFEALLSAGQASYNLKRYEQAVEYYVRATRAKPEEAVSWNNLANIERDLGQFEKAEKDYERALELKKEISYYVNLADLYRRWAEIEPKKLNQVEKVLLEALTEFPRQPALTAYLINFYEKIGERKKAEELR